VYYVAARVRTRVVFWSHAIVRRDDPPLFHGTRGIWFEVKPWGEYLEHEFNLSHT
jgi:hypothetical protein